MREAYGKIVHGQGSCRCNEFKTNIREFARSIGYSEEELTVIPEESNLALSCGNPTALANIQEGEVVLDLGYGAEFDCFPKASREGHAGRLIGVHMTPEMVEKARENAKRHGFANVEFRLGEIEHLPVADTSVDIVISNCIINLSADKPRVFREIYRVVRPGSRVAISDIALMKELPSKVRESIEAYVGCVGGAILVEEYKKIVEASGLTDVNITVKGSSSCIDPNTKDPIGRAILDNLGEGESLVGYVVSAYK